MLSSSDLYTIARAHYDEAGILRDSRKPNGAVYLCGYSLELILKRRIVTHLVWDGYPETAREFENYKSYKTHDLNVLLRLSGLEKAVQADTTIFAKWQIAKQWTSEMRYKVGAVTQAEAQDIISATKDVVNFVLGQP
jgi:hypothetical protein